MIKCILLPARGNTFDDAVWETALRIAQPFAAHVDLRYFCKQPGEMTETQPQAGRAIGRAALPALGQLAEKGDSDAREAHAWFSETCRRKGVELVDDVGEARRSSSVTASWHAERDGISHLAAYARHADLVVVGRPGRSNGLARSHVETVLATGGRPVLIAPSATRPHSIDTVFVCWKESPEAARALAAAMPLLARAERIVVASVIEDSSGDSRSLSDVARHLAFHAITAEARAIPRNGSIAGTLAAAAEAHEADLIVLGAYGHSKAREVVFGGCTRSFLDGANVPVLMMH
jgi:nucleotide-binding universal stress UspA family protein